MVKAFVVDLYMDYLEASVMRLEMVINKEFF